MAEVRSIEFNALPRSVRERFIACTNGQASPVPILAQKMSATAVGVGWIILSVLLGLIALVVLVVGFGDLLDIGIHGPSFVAIIYVPLGFLLLFCLLTAVTRFATRSNVPFPRGRYLFASDFVDARKTTLRIVPMSLLKDFNGTHMHTNGRYMHTTLTFTFHNVGQESFTVNGKDQAQALMNAFSQSQQAIAGAAQNGDWNTVAALDPFFEVRRMNAWNGAPLPDGGPQARPIPAFFRWRAAFALAAVVIFCPVLAVARNLLSDEAMFSNAKSADTEYAYNAYIRYGWRHVDEAKAAVPLAAFREAKKTNTVTAMRDVLKNYPGSPVEADARQYLHGLYAKTLADFKSKASTSDARMLPFMERLIAYLEKNDTATVRVVFKSPTNVALTDADTQFQSKYGSSGRTVAKISPFFDEKRSSPRETAIVSQLNSAFGAIFPTDVLKLEEAESSSSGKEPTIEIAYAVAPSGDAYKTRDSDRVYVGIVVNFAMKVAIPDETSGFDFKLSVEPPDEFTFRPSDDQNEEDATVYDTMAQRAFDEFTTKMRGIFFRA